MPAIDFGNATNLHVCSLLARCRIPCACQKNHIRTFKSGPSMWCFQHFDLETCSRHNGVHFFDISTSKVFRELVCFAHFDFKMCFAHLRATTACTFSTSQLPKVLREWCALYILTWKCASRHNGVHFFDISTSKSAPRMGVLCTF